MDNENKQNIIQVMTFLKKEIDRCHKTKLYWLLFYLDLECLTEESIKKSITGLNYEVGDHGPMPYPLENWIMNQVKKTDGENLSNYFKIERNNEYTFTPKQAFNENKFSSEQIKVMKKYAKIFKHSKTIPFDGEKKELQKELVTDFNRLNKQIETSPSRQEYSLKILEKLKKDKYLTIGLIDRSEIQQKKLMKQNTKTS